MSAVGSWRPVHGTHAIKSASVSVSLSENVGDITWHKVEAKAVQEATNGGLTERTPYKDGIPPILLSLGLPIVTPVGATFVRRESPELISESLSISRDVLRFETESYIRWAPFKARAKTLLGPLVPMMSEVCSIKAISSEYVDLFIANEAGDSPDVADIIDPSSPHVTRRSFHNHANWHCHTGWFMPAGASYRTLVNLNIDVIDPPEGEEAARQIQIKSHVAQQFGKGGLPPRLEPMSWPEMESCLDDAHQILKAVLAEVLTSAASTAISLNHVNVRS